MHKVGLILLLVLLPEVAMAQSTVATDAIQMLINLSNVYPNLWRMITAFCYVAGFSLALRGVYHLKAYGELRTMMATQTSLKTPIIFFIVAAVLMFIPTGFSMATSTVFGYGSPLKYTDINSTIDPNVLRAIVGLVNLVGLISFIRGWFILVAHAQQPGGQATVGKAATHIIGGLLAMNVVGLGQLIWNTFGFNFSL
jgi:intracellular multiplication protein IcmC